MSFWKVKNALRTLFTDPRKLVPFVLLLALTGFPIAMFSFSRGMSSRMLRQSADLRQQFPGHVRLPRTDGTRVTKDRSDFNPERLTPPRPQIAPETFAAAITVSLILIGIGVINTGLGDRLLALGPSDVDYLFPAPISRRIVLAYRLPSLTFGAVGIALYVLFMISMFTQMSDPVMPNSGDTVSPWWVNPVALFLSGGIYLNLAMTISIRVPKRSTYQKGLWIVSSLLGAAFAYVAWIGGVETAGKLLQAPALRVLFLPSALASDALIAAYSQQPPWSPLLWLLLGYVSSLALMFSSNANWYEQSIASTEKWTALRQAAKGGWAGVMAVKAASYKYKGAKEYTITPFGTHAGALFWAHLCAAAKKPIPNFILPLAAGLAFGGIGGTTIRSIMGGLSSSSHRLHSDIGTESLGYTVLGLMAFYLWQGFMTTSRTASEASIRRRELTAPLPIIGWQSVLADLGVPFCAVVICFVSGALAYLVVGGPSAAFVAFGFGLALPMRLTGRIALQHVVVIAYPDLADKIQRLISMLVGMAIGLPFLVLEAVACLPGLFFHSIWAALIPLTLIQIPLAVLFFTLAGKATERAIATGEPVRIFGLFSARA